MKVKDLINDLREFNPEAEIVSDVSFGWSAPDGASLHDSKKSTELVCIYSDDSVDVEEEL